MAPGNHRRLILVSRSMFLTMMSLLEHGSELPDLHQQQWQEHGPGPLQCVTQLPGVVAGCSWCQDICF